MKRKNLINLILAALFAALTYVITQLSMPIGSFGYIHVGDSMIYLAVSLLPLPYALPVAAIGAAFADLTLGYATYVIPTLLVKSALVLCAKGLSQLSKKPLVKDLLICLSGVITVVGYYIADVVLLLISDSEFSVIAAMLSDGQATNTMNDLPALPIKLALYWFPSNSMVSSGRKKLPSFKPSKRFSLKFA